MSPTHATMRAMVDHFDRMVTRTDSPARWPDASRRAPTDVRFSGLRRRLRPMGGDQVLGTRIRLQWSNERRGCGFGERSELSESAPDAAARAITALSSDPRQPVVIGGSPSDRKRLRLLGHREEFDIGQRPRPRQMSTGVADYSWTAAWLVVACVGSRSSGRNRRARRARCELFGIEIGNRTRRARRIGDVALRPRLTRRVSRQCPHRAG